MADAFASAAQAFNRIGIILNQVSQDPNLFPATAAAVVAAAAAAVPNILASAQSAVTSYTISAAQLDHQSMLDAS
jgi:hypothetical protein